MDSMMELTQLSIYGNHPGWHPRLGPSKRIHAASSNVSHKTLRFMMHYLGHVVAV